MIEVKKLSNGIPVVMEPMDYLKSISIGIWIKVGSVHETKDNNGMAHMIEHMLFKGTTHRTARRIADDIAKIGGNMNAYTSKECTSLYVTTLEEHAGEALDLMGDMICHSLILEDDVCREKGVIGEEIDMYNDSPEDLVHEMLQKEIWKDHSLGYIISGDKDTVNRFSREELVQFKERFYTAENMVISLCGGFQKETILPKLEQNFGHINRLNTTIEVSKPSYHRCFYFQNKDIEQIYMNVAFDCVGYNSQEKYVFAIVNSLLGGSENSRLFQKIREESGLTYSIYSYASNFQNAGLFHIDAILNPSKLFLVFDKIFDILKELKREGISKEELYRVKEQIKTEMIIEHESTKSRMNGNGKSYLSRGKVTLLEENIAAFDKVTLEEVATFMDTYLVPEKSSISLVGNLSKSNRDKIREKWNTL